MVLNSVDVLSDIAGTEQIKSDDEANLAIFVVIGQDPYNLRLMRG